MDPIHAENEPPDRAVLRITQDARDEIVRTGLQGTVGGTFRKTARIVGYPAVVPFDIETDRGLMHGEPGDWIVTNHPDDDAGSDIWTISAERMANTYERVP